MAKDVPTPEMLRKLLSYNPETGILTWKWRDQFWFKRSKDWRGWNTRYAGKEALASLDTNGYKHGSIEVLGLRKTVAHRVVFAIYYKHWPNDCVDHINGIRNDNRILNLREVTSRENNWNMARSTNNTSGVTGVGWNSRDSSWLAYIEVNLRRKYLGQFPTFDEAVAARKAAERRYNFHKNHGREQILKLRGGGPLPFS